MGKTSSEIQTQRTPHDPNSGIKRVSGIVIQDGFVSGKALRKASGFPSILETHCEDITKELTRLEDALQKALEDLDNTLSELDPDSESHAIFSSHLLMLKDPVLLDQVRNSIRNQKHTADYAWISALKSYYEQWKRAAKGSSMEQRTSDIIDIANRVYRLLNDSGESCDSTVGILVTEELSASDALALDPTFVKGVVCENGNETSHSAILIRSKGIPVIFGVHGLCSSINDDSWITVNGESGEVFIGYDSDLEKSINQKKAEYDEKMNYYATQVHVKPQFDGNEIRLLANVSSVDQIHDSIKYGAQGVGLFRTEFLYLNRISTPSEDEQFKKYRDALKAVQGHKLVIRTADFGGDKPISYLKWDTELNPFLGKRGIRYSLDEKTILRTQLRAILRAARYGKIDIMFPMISTLDEIFDIKTKVEQYRTELKDEGVEIGEVSLGIMIEVPAAALEVRELLREVDFVSIGTNDLIQYVMASDRTLDTLGELTSPLQPSVLKLIKYVIHEALNQHKEVTICGESAGDVRLTELFLAFGLRDFSMSPDRIPKVKEVIKNVKKNDVDTLSASFNKCRTLSDVQKLISK